MLRGGTEAREIRRHRCKSGISAPSLQQASSSQHASPPAPEGGFTHTSPTHAAPGLRSAASLPHPLLPVLLACPLLTYNNGKMSWPEQRMVGRQRKSGGVRARISGAP